MQKWFLKRCQSAIRTMRRSFQSPRLQRGLFYAVAILLSVALVSGSIMLSVSAAVCNKTEKQIMTVSELSDSGVTYDCILVLGCRVYEDGRLSAMLQDRVLTGVELFSAGVSNRLLMSGDHRTDAYDEVSAMKRFATEQGIASEQIFLDHDGYSTYDSIARLRAVFGGKRVVIVTQEYHLYRALYLAEQFGMEAVGVAADRQSYAKQGFREIREIAARCKDVYLAAKMPKPTVLGDPIDLSGNGNDTAQSRPN